MGVERERHMQASLDPEPSVSGWPAPEQLPPAVGGFVGRDPEMFELLSVLDRAGGNTIVISAVAGVGGIGKTALAIRWAHSVRERFPTVSCS